MTVPAIGNLIHLFGFTVNGLAYLILSGATWMGTAKYGIMECQSLVALIANCLLVLYHLLSSFVNFNFGIDIYFRQLHFVSNFCLRLILQVPPVQCFLLFSPFSIQKYSNDNIDV